ncbi:MAG: hypothetical protein GXP24_08065 [Planctomycetes bacterium]|nr:hypothetical protein [Planctomycetota bacterium]
MNRHFLFGVSSLVFVACGFSTGLREAHAEPAVLQASAELRWYRGNMHTHSHWSDGDDYLEMIGSWYRDNGYQFLVFTDHNVLANTERWINVKKSKGGPEAFGKLIAEFPRLIQHRITDAGELEVRLRTFQEVAAQLNDPGEYLLVQGEEISDAFEGLPIHINASNVVDLIAPMKGRSVSDTIQNNVRAVIAQREETGQPMIVHVNHPNFGYAITAEDLMRVRGEQFFEVYNGHPSVYNAGDALHAGTERVWDIILTHRLTDLQLPMMYGLAVDDGHDYHKVHSRNSNAGRGWVMVLAKDLTAASLIDSLETGRFYATSGVTLRSVESSAEALTVEVEPVDGETYTIDFIGTRQGFDTASHPIEDGEGKRIRATRRYSTDIGETFATVEGNRGTYQFKGDEIYVRARITSSAKHPRGTELGEQKRAWVQPVVQR